MLVKQIFHLSPREKEICALIAEGWDNQVIGTKLGLLPNTVAAYITRIFSKHVFESYSHRRVAFTIYWNSNLAETVAW